MNRPPATINTSTPLTKENKSKSSDLGQTHEGASPARTHQEETVLMDADLSSVVEDQVPLATQASAENEDWIEDLEKAKKAKGIAAKQVQPNKNVTRAKATVKKAPRRKAPAKSMPKSVEKKSKSWNVGRARPGIDFPDDSDDDDDMEWKAFKERQKLREEKRKMLTESKGETAKEVMFQHQYRDSSSSTSIDAHARFT